MSLKLLVGSGVVVDVALGMVNRVPFDTGHLLAALIAQGGFKLGPIFERLTGCGAGCRSASARRCQGLDVWRAVRGDCDFGSGEALTHQTLNILCDFIVDSSELGPEVLV